MKCRKVAKVLVGRPTFEGDGFLVHRPFPTKDFSYFDPFLLLDEMGPSELAPGDAKGASDHPHRGFETVTYMLEGEMEHRDSQGNQGRLRPGDVQWMTAGAGVVHSEMPSAEFQRRGGKMHGFQLWVNLPKTSKLATPRYQELKSASIPETTTNQGRVRVRVIAGEFEGTRAVTSTLVPIHYLDVQAPAGEQVEISIPAGFNAMIYVIRGAVSSGSDEATSHEALLFENEGDSLKCVAGPDGVRLLLLAGQPVAEPVARLGPFVMNTQAELQEAVEDYRSGKMGQISGEVVNL